MHTTNLRKVGGSVMMAVPPAILDMLKLAAGSTVAVTVDAGRLIVEPRQRPRYTLDELLAQCDPDAPMSKDDREWTRGAAAGDELI
jgi:antitoxin ChpS